MDNMYVEHPEKISTNLQNTNKEIFEFVYHQNPEKSVSILRVRITMKHYNIFWCEAQCLYILFAPIPLVRFILSLNIPIKDVYGSSLVHLLCISILHDSSRTQFVLEYLNEQRHQLPFHQLDSFQRSALFYNNSLEIYNFLVKECQCDPYILDTDFNTIAYYYLIHSKQTSSNSLLFKDIYIPLFSEKMIDKAIRNNNKRNIHHILSFNRDDDFYHVRLYMSKDFLSLDEVKAVNQYLLQQHYSYNIRMDFLVQHLAYHSLFVFQEFSDEIFSNPNKYYYGFIQFMPDFVRFLCQKEKKKYLKAFQNYGSLSARLTTNDDDVKMTVKQRSDLLYFAVDYGYVDMVHFYLQYGASANHQNDFGETSLHILYGQKHKYEKNRWKDIYDLLIQYGAHEDILNGYSEMANPKLRTQKVLDLQCLAAKSIRNPTVYYDQLPPQIVQFVKWHHKYSKQN